MQVWWLFTINCFDFFWVYAGLRTWSSLNLNILKKHQHFDAKSAQNLHILKKIKKKWSSKVTKPAYTQKKSKKSKTNWSMPVSPTYRVWNFCFFLIFLSICRFGDFSLSKLLIFLSICRFGDFSLSKLLIFLSICRFEGLEVHETCIYSKKINILMPKVHKTCIYSKKSKKWSSKVTKPAYTQKNQKNQKLIDLCQSVPHRVWNFVFFWFFWVYAGLVTFPYQNFWFFWVYAGLVTFPYQNFWFFWVYAGLRDLKFTKPAYTQKKSTFWCQKCTKPAYTQKNQKNDRQKSPNLHILKKIKKIKN